MAEKKEESRNKKQIGGIFIPAGLFVGLGVGFLGFGIVMLIGRD